MYFFRAILLVLATKKTQTTQRELTTYNHGRLLHALHFAPLCFAAKEKENKKMKK